MNRKALYAGSFDPMTVGHFDLIKRAAAMYDQLEIGIIVNPSKTPFFSLEQRIRMVEKTVEDLPNVEVNTFSGLLAEYVNQNGFDVVLRGLRATTDFEYEIQMAQMNARLYEGSVETVFLMTNPKYSFLSSSLIKEVFNLGGNIEDLVPEEIYKYMIEKRNSGVK